MEVTSGTAERAFSSGVATDVAMVSALAPRRYIVEAPLYWLNEFNLDGLRFDAIDQIEDLSQKHVLVEIAERIRAEITDRGHLSPLARKR